MNRRVFIKNAAVISSSLSVMSSLSTFDMNTTSLPSEIGLQLWTVRDAMKKDPVGTLKLIKDAGYTHVECAGYEAGKYYGFTVKQFANILNRIGLKMISSHTLIGQHAPQQKNTMINNWEAACADAAEIGQSYIVCAYLFDFERKGIDDYKKHAELFNRCGEIAKQYKIQLAYHNHDFEFLNLDGEIPFDVLLAETEKDLLHFELDLYWIKKAGKDTEAYFLKAPGRYPLWHVKDMDNSPEQYFTEVGRGIIDWKKMFGFAELAGLKQFYVEQDDCKGRSPLESIQISQQYLSSM